MVAGERLKKRVGRSVAKKPETLNLEEVLGSSDPEPEPEPESVVTDGKPYKDSMGMTVDPVEEANHKARFAHEQEWMKLRSSWSEETRNRIVMEFIRNTGLFEQLVKYARKQKR